MRKCYVFTKYDSLEIPFEAREIVFQAQEDVE